MTEIEKNIEVNKLTKKCIDESKCNIQHIDNFSDRMKCKYCGKRF